MRKLTGVPFLVSSWEKLCIDNMYVTTIHVINSAIVKLSKLTVVTPVYRGVQGGMLPEKLLKPD